MFCTCPATSYNQALVQELDVLSQSQGRFFPELPPIFSSKALKNDVWGVARMQKKAPGYGSVYQKSYSTLFFIFCLASSFPIFFKKLLEARPLASRVPSALCSAMKRRK
jgi:hypothetical protein